MWTCASTAAAIFDRALSLLDEPAGEIDLASALAVLGSIDDEGEYDYPSRAEPARRRWQRCVAGVARRSA